MHRSFKKDKVIVHDVEDVGVLEIQVQHDRI